MVATSVLGCADPTHDDTRDRLDTLGTLVSEPRIVRFTPDVTQARVELVNHGSRSVALAKFHIGVESPDWGSFTIENRTNPRVVEPHQRVAVELRVHARNFAERGRDDVKRYHAANATLRFLADDQPRAVGLRCAQPDVVDRHISDSGITLLALLGVFVLCLGLGPDRDVTAALRLWRRRPGVAFGDALVSVLPALAVFAIAPLADGICSDALAVVISEADVAQCRDGRAGTPLALFTGAHSSLVALTALAAAAGWLGISSARATERARSRQRGALAHGVLFVALLATLVAHDTLDLHRLGLAPWGVLRQPIACALMVYASACALLASERDDRPVGLQRLALAALVCVGSLGAWTLPGGVGSARGITSPQAAGLVFLLAAALGAFGLWRLRGPWSQRARARRAHRRGVLGSFTTVARALALGALTLSAAVLAVLMLAGRVPSLLAVSTGLETVLRVHGVSVTLALAVTTGKLLLVSWGLKRLQDALRGRQQLLDALPLALLVALGNLAIATALRP